MYRNGKIYDELDKMVCDIYIDYGFHNFPLDEKAVCSTMGISLIPYSECCLDEKNLLRKKSKYGFFVRGNGSNPPMIFYNDDLSEIQSYGCIRFTIFHEIKHYVCDDSEYDEFEDDLADHFGRYFLCPTPYLIIKDIIDPAEIASLFGVSTKAAQNISNNVKNRIEKHGHNLFDYEKSLIRQLIH